MRTGGEVWKDLNRIFISNRLFGKKIWRYTCIGMTMLILSSHALSQVKKIEHKTHTQYILQRQIDEICLEDPRNRVRIICEEFTKRYPPDRVPKLYYGGDRTSMKESTLKEKGENFYTDVAKPLEGIQ